MHPVDEQLSILPLDAPVTVVLEAAQLVRRIERLAPGLYPRQILTVRGDLSLVHITLDRYEGWARGYGRIT